MNRRIGLLATGAAVALVAGGGTALAASAGPVSSSGVISGCYTNAELNGSHAFVLQDAGTNCPSGTTAVSWNEQGPAGPAGPPGAAGPQGPAGPAGANGSSVVTSPAAPTGSCTSGDTDIDLADGEVWACSSGAWADTVSSVQGPQGPQGPAGVGTAGPGGLGVTIVTSSVSVPVGGEVGPVVYCPAAEPYVLSGGGQWQYVSGGTPSDPGPGGPYIGASMPITEGTPTAGPESAIYSNGWAVEGANNGALGIPDTLSVWAICSA